VGVTLSLHLQVTNENDLASQLRVDMRFSDSLFCTSLLSMLSTLILLIGKKVYINIYLLRERSGFYQILNLTVICNVNYTMFVLLIALVLHLTETYES
jgi:hypothetical protein